MLFGIDVILFLQFGFMLNAGFLIAHIVLSVISAVKQGQFKSMVINEKITKSYLEYKELMLKHKKLKYYLDNSSFFIPFYSSWRMINIWLSVEFGKRYLESFLDVMLREIEELHKLEQN